MIKQKISYLIIANEFCERYCFYALKTILFTFLRNEYDWSQKKSTFVVHLFVSMCYLFTLFGGIISDMFLGKFKTILCLSVVYFVGTVLITYSSYTYNSTYAMYLGLGLISLGTGGIKPCVAAFGGDQMEDEEDHKELTSFFNFFYFAINLGSMISTFFVPLMAEISCFGKNSCYPLAFGSSSVLLMSSIIFFFLGSKYYIKKKPNKENFINQIKNIRWKSKQGPVHHSKNDDLFDKPEGNSITQDADIENLGQEILEKREEKYNISNIFKLFLPIIFFWMLYDQQSSTWIEQGFKMSNSSTFFTREIHILSSQMQTFNSVFILCFIPLFSTYLYPFIEYLGFKLTPIKKMGGGVFLASLSFLISAFLEHKIDLYALENQKISILWQLPQYLVLTAGEILLNMTGLEFAYSEAPDTMKTIILSSWLLTVTFGNILVIFYSIIDPAKWIKPAEPETFNFLMYAFLGICAAFYMLKLEKVYEKNK
jgi:dipeptide/tripeptide permease